MMKNSKMSYKAKVEALKLLNSLQESYSTKSTAPVMEYGHLTKKAEHVGEFYIGYFASYYIFLN